jgi:hypothetical protein
MITALLLAIVRHQAATPVLLKREYKANEKLAYAVRSTMHSDLRGGQLITWLPEDLGVNYDFSLVVEQLKPDGIAVVRYRRPTVDEVHGETFDTPEKTEVVHANIDYRLTVSPFNEVLDMRDLATKKNLTPWPTARTQEGGDMVTEFLSEMARLALFVGNLDSALDLAPKTPFDAVKVGDTWKRTVGYQPQKLKGKNELAVQRLDYTYTFQGLVDSEKGKVLRVQAKLDFSNDLAEFLRQVTESDLSQAGLGKLPMKLSATIDFDLDPKTKLTLRADARSEAGFQIFKPDAENPLYEEKMKGHTTLALVGRAMVKPAK